MLPVILAVLLLTLGPNAVQQKPALRKPSPAKSAVVQCPKQVAKDACERGWQLLETAEAEASAMDEPGMRAYALLQIARPYALSQKAKAVSLLNNAFTASLAVPDDKHRPERVALQRDILVTLAPLAPQRAEELLQQAAPSVREGVLQALLGYFEKEKRFEKAMEMINRIAQDGAFPYAAVSSLMKSVPPDKTMERQQLFTTALNNFRTNPPGRLSLRMGKGSGDFTELITLYWQELPVPLVREAIDEVLKTADRNADKDTQAVRPIFAYSGGNAAFDSWYEYRIFQLLPVLKQIDPDAAESLVKEHKRVAKQLDAYVQAGSPAFTAGGMGPVPPQIAQMAAAPRLEADPVNHPDEALEKVLALPEASSQARYLLSFARATVEKNPTAAKNFLAKFLDPVASQIDPYWQPARLADAAALYLRLNDSTGARKAVEAGVALVPKLYADDTNADDPHTALKAFWPSTNAWIRFARLASRVSPDLALGIVKDIRDDEIRPIVRMSLAGAWIGAPLGPSLVYSKKRDSAWGQPDDLEVR